MNLKDIDKYEHDFMKPEAWVVEGLVVAASGAGKQKYKLIELIGIYYSLFIYINYAFHTYLCKNAIAFIYTEKCFLSILRVKMLNKRNLRICDVHNITF